MIDTEVLTECLMNHSVPNHDTCACIQQGSIYHPALSAYRPNRTDSDSTLMALQVRYDARKEFGVRMEQTQKRVQES
jgi:hypothetical protein